MPEAEEPGELVGWRAVNAFNERVTMCKESAGSTTRTTGPVAAPANRSRASLLALHLRASDPGTEQVRPADSARHARQRPGSMSA